jgi:hypothetical protein
MSGKYDLPVGTWLTVRPVGAMPRFIARRRRMEGMVESNRPGDDVVVVRFSPDGESDWTLHFSKAGGIAKASADYVLELT